MANFDVNVIENSARRCVLNISSHTTDGCFITGGMVSLTGTAVSDTVSLITGYKDNTQGETTTRLYTNKVPVLIQQAIFGHSASGASTKLHALSGASTAAPDEVIASYDGSGSVTYDPPLQTSFDCDRPNFYLERSSNDATLYLILVPEDTNL